MSVDPTRVKDLTNRVKERRTWRAEDAERSRPLKERWEAISGEPDVKTFQFWCEDKKCKRDFVSLAFKQVRKNQGWPLAWYVGQCPLGHECMRRITDKGNDPYFYQSEMLARERVRYADDFLTPDDPRFRMKYPKMWEKLEADKEQAALREALMNQ